jgi:hypothetical protein
LTGGGVYDFQNSDAAQGSTDLVAQLVEPTVIVPVPEPRERAMPPQPLGELPEIRPAYLWASFAQAAWRAVATLLSSMFVRSEQ